MGSQQNKSQAKKQVSLKYYKPRINYQKHQERVCLLLKKLIWEPIDIKSLLNTLTSTITSVSKIVCFLYINIHQKNDIGKPFLFVFKNLNSPTIKAITSLIMILNHQHFPTMLAYSS
ncbi:hypothetical protein Sez_1488 [Streptococcus equi subsp. zooepidemicus MGCS10565]|uniref:Uncharacterized protein n=1 Tax=Streptococcus equi subsp. zooepidemicus (strain MGCS10565) TaxID=552526 RepID=B4U4A4_STREM|nr:hypothetical protein Sez_1488 [Streptococcus equi subsp. zooepidemicus MGCS10565]